MLLCFLANIFSFKDCFFRKSVGSEVPRASGKPSTHKTVICMVDVQMRNACQTPAIKTGECH